jgi:DNA-binding transcriptional regulator YdaS (Cro superfamily)
MTRSAVVRAIKIIGGQAATARVLEVSQPRVWYWANKAKKLPRQFAIPLERATKARVTRQQLRPDLFGKPSR